MRLSLCLPLLFHLYAGPVSTSPLIDRAICATYCGYSSLLCCSAGYVCYTDQNNQAQCSITSYNPTPSTVAGFAATTTSTLICNGNQGQTACGDKCCNAGQICLQPGQCNGTSAIPTAATTATVTSVSATVVGTSATSTVTTTATSAGAGSTASSSSTVIAGNQGLDSGSIAGIVIGVVVGVVVLIWMCKPITNKRSEKLSSVSSRSSRGSRRRSTVVM